MRYHIENIAMIVAITAPIWGALLWGGVYR
jgi:hypothetical protein